MMIKIQWIENYNVKKKKLLLYEWKNSIKKGR